MAIKVRVRQKKISGNRQSLYLDFYPAIPHPKTGEPTRREFLGIYLLDNPKSVIDKLHNKDSLQIAQQIRQKRENQLNKPEIYTEYEKEQMRLKQLGSLCFVEYFRKLINKKKASNFENWLSTLNYLEKFTGGSWKFSDLNETSLEKLKDYLLTVKSKRSDKTFLSRNTAASYFNKIKAALRQAFKDGILQIDLNSKISPIKSAETRREFLTLEELNQLVKTPCNNDLLKRAALFSAMTGLRFSDIAKMLWKEIEYIKDHGYCLKFIQKKTGQVEMLPISDEARRFMGAEGKPEEKVFEGLNYSAYENKHLYQWIGAAGITKDITFHCFRHTFATLQISEGTDIYTLSKMLGHRNLKTTQIYAKVMDHKKREAANKIKLNYEF